jgi:hypothetical protein
MMLLAKILHEGFEIELADENFFYMAHQLMAMRWGYAENTLSPTTGGPA